MKPWPRAVGVFVMLSLLSAACAAAELENSGFALAYPVEGIRIDGDLSDWPSELPWYAADAGLLGSPRNEQDFSARFRIGYHESENALYVAFAVQDAVEPEPDDGSMIISTDEMLETFLTDMVRLDIWIPREGASWLRMGFMRSEAGAQTVTYWGPGWAAYGRAIAFVAEVGVGGGQRSYEFRIGMTEMSQGRFHLRAGEKIEMYAWIQDLDVLEDGPDRRLSTVLGWSRGEILLVASGVKTGRLNGQVKAVPGPVARLRKKIRIEPLGVSNSVVQAFTDGAGRFTVHLPEGRYGVDLAERGNETKPDAQVEVRAGSDQVVELLAGPVTGREFRAQPARVQRAGRGARQGHWRVYGVADGLPGMTVRAIVQDGQGALWLGLDGAGLSRFDGARFSSYATEEMLGSSSIWRMVEDGEGNLWLMRT